MVSHEGAERFVANAKKGTKLVYRYFDLSNVRNIAVTARGQGVLQILFDDVVMGELSFCCRGWEKRKSGVSGGVSHSTVSLMIQQGKLDIISFAVEE